MHFAVFYVVEEVCRLNVVSGRYVAKLLLSIDVRKQSGSLVILISALLLQLMSSETAFIDLTCLNTWVLSISHLSDLVLEFWHYILWLTLEVILFKVLIARSSIRVCLKCCLVTATFVHLNIWSVLQPLTLHLSQTRIYI